MSLVRQHQTKSGNPQRTLTVAGILLLTALLLVTAGCATNGYSWKCASGGTARPDNVYLPQPYLPIYIRRVAVLPISVPNDDWQAAEGRSTLEGVLRSELGKTERFEVIAISPEQLQILTGRSYWKAEERLPANFFPQLREAFGCDAVLFTRLAPYHPYQPIVVGWNLKLVDSHEQQIIWSSDEVFDASQATVAQAARCYHASHFQESRPLSDTSSILLSPRRFSQFTLETTLAALPKR